jgi:ABC-type Fe3+-siderophore transport system permease subunit
VVWWLLGNLQIFDLPLLHAAAVVVGTGLAVTMLLARDLNVMTLGEEPAAHLGLDAEKAKRLFLLVASLMTGATVAACGLIGFVGQPQDVLTADLIHRIFGVRVLVVPNPVSGKPHVVISAGEAPGPEAPGGFHK